MKTDTKIIFLLAVVLVILLGGIYLVFRMQKEKVEQVAFNYNGFNIKKSLNGYKVEIFINNNNNPNYFTVRADPREIETIPVDVDTNALKNMKQVYAVIDPYENLTGVTTMAVLELENVIENPFLFNIPLNSAFIREREGKKMDVKTCKDANETVAVIWLRMGETTRIFSEDKCIVIEGPLEDDLVRASDRLTLTMLGVINK